MADRDIKFIWRRTDFGDGPKRHDFLATVANKAIGRIYRIPHHPNYGCWRWSLTLTVPGVPYPQLPPRNGIAETKEEAIEQIGWAFALVRDAKEQSDIEAGCAPAGVLDHLCSFGDCTLPGHGEPRLCYGHGQHWRSMVG